MKTIFVSIILAISLLAAPALANPGSGLWVDKGGATRTQAKPGFTVFYFFTTVDSKLIKVPNFGDFCFDPDGEARVTIRRVIFQPITANAIAISIPFDLSNCIPVVVGSYWVEVTTPAGGGETPVVSLTGRN